MNSSRITFTLNELVYVLNSAADRHLRANFDLTYSQFLFLVTLMSQNKPTPSFLAECLGVSRAAVSQRLPWFQDRELVTVSRVSGNEKNLSLELTRKGEALATQSADFLEKEFRVLFQNTDSVDLDDLDKTLRRVKQLLFRNRELRNAA
ncbi:MAG: winged helix-turn-helix transcriptional regulator [Microbacteriaceae bacterium]|jgi:DNA-binding MarR family transcriptional regulator|nr:winged helix-turn-helix transcriptional regulator [Microbacteriaceae bacterium]